MRILLLTAVLTAVTACRSYPHDPVICTDDSECADGHSCLPEWQRVDGGTCLAVEKSCQKICSDDGDCEYCGTFGICARHICDSSAPTTCGSFCGDGRE